MLLTWFPPMSTMTKHVQNHESTIPSNSYHWNTASWSLYITILQNSESELNPGEKISHICWWWLTKAFGRQIRQILPANSVAQLVTELFTWDMMAPLSFINERHLSTWPLPHTQTLLSSLFHFSPVRGRQGKKMFISRAAAKERGWEKGRERNRRGG